MKDKAFALFNFPFVVVWQKADESTIFGAEYQLYMKWFYTVPEHRLLV